MERYAKVQSSLWTSSKKFKKLNIKDRYVYLYLLTCQHGNSAGIYRMIPNYCSYDCDMELEDYNRSIVALCKANLISFDSNSNIVLIHQYMKFNPITNEKHAKGTSKVAKEFIESSVYSVWATEVIEFYKGFDSCIDSPMDSESIQQNTDNRIQNTDNREETTEKKPLSKVFDDDSAEIGIAKYLFLNIQNINQNAKEPNYQTWAKYVDYMLRLDNRSKKDIKLVIDFATKDNFWQSNILSTSKLREKFDTLYLQAINKKVTPNGKSKLQKQIDVCDEWVSESEETHE